MRGDSGTLESLLSGAGMAVAAGVILFVIFILYRSTGPADAAIALQTATAEICGDIGTVAASSVPGARCEFYSLPGIMIRITSDYVVAGSLPDGEFARPLAVRVYPGNFSCQDGTGWNDTAGLRAYFNDTFGRPGTRELPFDVDNGSRASALLADASRDMGHNPLFVDLSRTLTIEKLFLFTHNVSSDSTESEPYVFVYQ
jgi:hypothetical protein